MFVMSDKLLFEYYIMVMKGFLTRSILLHILHVLETLQSVQIVFTFFILQTY